jgi:hypothetical protein
MSLVSPHWGLRVDHFFNQIAENERCVKTVGALSITATVLLGGIYSFTFDELSRNVT